VAPYVAGEDPSLDHMDDFTKLRKLHFHLVRHYCPILDSAEMEIASRRKATP
jgi:hypothetical protein